MKRILLKCVLYLTDYRNNRRDKNFIERFLGFISDTYYRVTDYIYYGVFKKIKIIYYSNGITIILKDPIITILLRDISCGNKYHGYLWEKLRKSVLKYGIVNYIIVKRCNMLDMRTGIMCKYCVVDGDHRVIILKELYPSNYEIKVKLIDE